MSFSTFIQKRILLLLTQMLVIAFILPVKLFAADVVILKNGDRITGEVKKLNNAALEVDPPYGENIFIIDWNEVERIESKSEFIAQTSAGDYVTGSVRTDPDNPNRVLVEGETEVLPVEQSELVYLKAVDEGFWGRLSVALDFGLSLTKAEDTKQMSTRASAGYLTEHWSASLLTDALRNVRNDTDTTRRTEIGEIIVVSFPAAGLPWEMPTFSRAPNFSSICARLWEEAPGITWCETTVGFWRHWGELRGRMRITPTWIQPSRTRIGVMIETCV